LIIVIVQIILGTAVREQTDEISKALNYQNREQWIGRMDNDFFIHRSFSWIVAAACVFLFLKSRPVPSFRRHAFAVLSFMLIAFGAGLAMFFMHIPAWAQPLHLLFASLLAISLFSFRLQMK
ncbi:MAG: COX15/CtaA family protein, partial [Bacteroidota bacterium]